MIQTKHKDIEINFVDWRDGEGWKFQGDPNDRTFPKLSSCKEAIDKMLSVKYHEQQVFQFKNGGYMGGMRHPKYRAHDTEIDGLIATRPHRDSDKEFWVKERNPKNPKANRPALSRGSLFLDNAHNRAVIPKLINAHAKVIEAEAKMIEIFKSLELLTGMEAVK